MLGCNYNDDRALEQKLVFPVTFTWTHSTTTSPPKASSFRLRFESLLSALNMNMNMNLLSALLVGCVWMGAVVDSAEGSDCSDTVDVCLKRCEDQELEKEVETECFQECYIAQVQCASQLFAEKALTLCEGLKAECQNDCDQALEADLDREACYPVCDKGYAECMAFGANAMSALAADGRADFGSMPRNSMNIYGDPQQTNMNDDNDRKCKLWRPWICGGDLRGHHGSGCVVGGPADCERSVSVPVLL